MKIDLFATTCFSLETSHFGIYDARPAQVVPIDKGIVKVKNEKNCNVYFVPLDKNIICYKQNSKDEESQCDALLICLRPQKQYDFYFIELKEKEKNWIQDGIRQLKMTILTVSNTYSLSCLSKKVAFLANRKHPHYNYTKRDDMELFRKETGFRLNICATVSIK